jgi:hypothetical protein
MGAGYKRMHFLVANQVLTQKDSRQSGEYFDFRLRCFNGVTSPSAFSSLFVCAIYGLQ